MATQQLSTFLEKKKKTTAAAAEVPGTEYNMSVCLMTAKMERDTYLTALFIESILLFPLILFWCRNDAVDLSDPLLNRHV